MAPLTDTAAATGDHVAARTLVERLAPFATHVNSPSPVLVQGATARPLARGADADVERARELVTSAAATAAEYGCGGLTERAAALLADL